jgi:hypothetical protein
MSYFKDVHVTDKTTGLRQHVIDDGAGRVINQTYLQGIAEGDITGHNIYGKKSYHPATTASETTLWGLGTQYVFPAAEVAVEAVSSSADDDGDPGGTGARTMHLIYLDDTYAQKEHTFTLNGTIAVAGPTDVFRVNSFHVETAGSSGKPAGNITLRLVGAPATPYSYVLAGTTNCRCSAYTVPLGKAVYIQDITFTSAYSTAGKSVRITFHASITPDGVVSTAGTIFWCQFEAMVVDGSVSRNTQSVLIFPEKTDMKVSVQGETNAKCTADITGWIESYP